MNYAKCFDAATQIPQVAPDGCKAALGYIGPDPEAAHVWTLAEWQRFGHLFQFPAWLANAGSADLASEGTAQAEQAVEAAVALGWHHGRVIICDLEAWRDPVYWRAWRARVEKMNFQAGDYSSESNAADYPSDWKWLALYDGVADIPAGYAAKQYAANVQVPGGVVDLSVVSNRLLEHAGVGPRHLVGH